MIRATALNESAEKAERRQFQRVRVKVGGRFTLEDPIESPCQVTDMSPGNVSLRAGRIGSIGERVVAHIDQIGRVEGVVTRILEDGFAMTIVASDRKKDKLAAQLTWLANKNELDLPEDRRHVRVIPRNSLTTLQIQDGISYTCRIADLSLSGAAIELDAKPELGAKITLGKLKGEVVRHFEDGIAIEFATVQLSDTLEAEFSKSN